MGTTVSSIARGPITISIMLASTMNTLDTTIANVALPHMQGSLSASQDQITWVLTSYIVAQALMTPLTGWLAGRIGRRHLMLVSIAGFTVASAACGIATSLTEIVLFRVLQGIFGASFIPLSQAILFDINPPQRYPQAMAMFGAGVVLGPVVGPALGGWLTDAFDWRWVFLINLPVGLLAFGGTWLTLPEHKAETSRPFDLAGFGALALFIAAIQLFLDRGPGQDWFESWEIWIDFALAGLGLYLFVILTATSEHPFFSRGLLLDANFMTGCFVGFATGVLLYSAMALLPPLMQQLLGYPVVTTGIVTMPRGVGMFFSMFLVGRLLHYIDVRLVLLTGLALNALALWQMTWFTLEMDSHLVVTSGFIQGFGIGLIFVPLSTLAFSSVSTALRTEASSIFTLVRNLGSSAGISVMQALFARNVQVAHASLAEGARLDNPNFQSMGSASFNLNSLDGMLALNGEITRQAAMISYIDDFYFVMALSICAMPLVLLLRPPKFVTAEDANALVE
ncbi:MAG: MDR family MFS transporter [Micropepsaceae bacterium]